MQILKKANINFLGIRKFAFVLSTSLVVLSVIYLFVKAPNWGIDFTGGSLIHLKVTSETTTGELRKSLEKSGLSGISIQKYRDTGGIIIRVRKMYAAGDIVNKVNESLQEHMPELKFEIIRNEMVGPAVGSYLRETAVKAFIFAFVAMIIYIAIRFKGGIWGFAAVIALIHDVIITFGMLNYLGITIDLPVVAALLTLAGYSINDSIVIYDRIRENIRIHYKKKLSEIINRSINATLSRTIITSGTTLVVVIALMLKGGEVLHGFATTLFMGILVGTYSSIFVASPLVYVWQRKK